MGVFERVKGKRTSKVSRAGYIQYRVVYGGTVCEFDPVFLCTNMKDITSPAKTDVLIFTQIKPREQNDGSKENRKE
jgi:hypothetical protein